MDLQSFHKRLIFTMRIHKIQHLFAFVLKIFSSGEAMIFGAMAAVRFQGVSMLRRNAIALLCMLSVVCLVSWLPAQTLAPRPFQFFGQPRITQGHPRTAWDQKDITSYKDLLKSSPELKATFDQLRVLGDKRITQPLNVPAHTLETDRKWTFPAFKRGYQDSQGKWMWEWNFNTAMQQRSADVSNLGILYALWGELITMVLPAGTTQPAIV